MHEQAEREEEWSVEPSRASVEPKKRNRRSRKNRRHNFTVPALETTEGSPQLALEPAPLEAEQESLALVQKPLALEASPVSRGKIEVYPI